MRLCLIAAMLFPTYLFADPARRDIYGDPLPEGAIQRLGTARLKHPYGTSITLSRDGKTVVTHGPGFFRLWSALSGKLVRTSSRQSLPDCCTISDDGRSYFGRDRYGVFVRDIETLRDTHRFAGDLGGAIHLFVESSDPNIVAMLEYNRGGVWIWDLKSETTRKLGEVGYLCRGFFADRDHLVTVPFPGINRDLDLPGILVWNVQDGARTMPRAGGPDWLNLDTISASQPWLISRSRNSDLIQELWDPSSGKKIGSKLLPVPYRLLRSPDSRFHLIETDYHSELWNRRLDRKITDLGKVECWVFSGDGKSLFTLGNSLQRIDLRTGKAVWTIPSDGRTRPADGLRWDDSDRLLVRAPGPLDSFLSYDVRTGRSHNPSELPEFASIPFCLPDQTSSDDRITRSNSGWLVRPGPFVIPDVEGRTRNPTNVSPLGDLLAGRQSADPDSPEAFSESAPARDNDSLVVWERITGDRIFRFDRIGEGRFVFHPSGRLIATTDPEGIRVWDGRTGELLRRFHDFGSPGCNLPTCVSFSPDGKKLATAHWDSTVLIWDVSDHVSSTNRRLENAEIQLLWQLLRRGRGPEANSAIWKLVGSPETVLPFLRANLLPIPIKGIDDLAPLFGDLLEPTTFRRRETVLRKFEEMSDEVVAPLQELLTGGRIDDSLTRRFRSILAQRGWKVPPSGPDLQAMRAIRLLELIGGKEAQKQVEKLSEGYAEARSTQEALAALARMKSSK